GRPISSLTVSIVYIIEFPAELLKKIRDNAGKMNPPIWGEMQNAFVPGKDGQPQAVRTGSDGRFRMTGVGRDRVALLLIEGESIERSFALVLTTGDPNYKPLVLPGGGPVEQKLEGPRLDLTIAPGRMVE